MSSDRASVDEERALPGQRFSVVVPLYNKAPWILRCLDSIRASDTGAIGEVIVVDDGSTDDGGRLAREARAGYGKIKVVSQPNRGVSSARNRGIEAATNEHVLLLDADDEWRTGFVQEIFELLKACPDAVVASTSYSFVLPDGKRYGPNYALDVLGSERGAIEDFVAAVARGDSPAHSSCSSIKKTAWKAVGGFPEGVTHGEDKIFWMRMACHGSVAWSPSVQMLRHITPGHNADSTWRPEKGTRYLDEVSRLLQQAPDAACRKNLLDLYCKELSQFGRAAARKRELASVLWASRELARERRLVDGMLVVGALFLPYGGYSFLKAAYKARKSDYRSRSTSGSPAAVQGNAPSIVETKERTPDRSRDAGQTR